MHAIYLAHIQTAASVPRGAAATGGSVIAAAWASIAVLLLLFGIALFIACQAPAPGSSGDGDIDSGGGGGGGGPGGPPGPGGRPPQPGSGPVWWSEFEQQFAAYVEHARGADPVVVTAQAD